MTKFIRLLDVENKESSLLSCLHEENSDFSGASVYEVDPEVFFRIPGAPFAYWASDKIRDIFSNFSSFEGEGRYTSVGASTKDDFRYVRSWVEVDSGSVAFDRFETSYKKWVSFVKGGKRSSFYSDPSLVVNWLNDGKEVKAAISEYRGSRGWGYQWSAALNGHDYYFTPGVTWPLRGNFYSGQAVPEGCIFSVAGKMAFAPRDDLLLWVSVFNSKAFNYLIGLFAGTFRGAQYEAGLIARIPIPSSFEFKDELGSLAKKAWKAKMKVDRVNEFSHVFTLPEVLFNRFLSLDIFELEKQVGEVHKRIDELVFDDYGFYEKDRIAAEEVAYNTSAEDESEDDEEDGSHTNVDETCSLSSWLVGVGFGRFDFRLATGEREIPPEPEPFDPLPAKSPGMLPDGAEPYHRHAGILVDDPGHEHDLPRLMADVLETVDVQIDEDLRRWLRRDFFKYHLQQYSKSRRKAPIYWPLATASGSYTLWLYYPDLTDQTLFTAVNDFVEPKLKQVDRELGNLRLAGTSRSRADEKRLEELSDFRNELADLRDTLLKIAPDYKPNHDDGVQITAAPLWPLFRHRPWQNVLRETWERLEQGDYDWAHLAMAYWPERVREKCVTDKSLAIAHDLEHLYVEPEPAPKKARGRKKSTGSSE